MKLFYILILFPLSMFGQYYSSKVVLENGEEFSGLVEFNYDEGINFKNDDAAGIRVIPSDEVKSVLAAINDTVEQFIYHKGESPFDPGSQSVKKRLFKVLKTGKVNLYEYQPNTALVLMSSTDITALYLHRPSEEYATFFSSVQRGMVIAPKYSRYGFRKFMSKYFSDCQFLLEKVDNKELKAKHSLEIVDFYNTSCK